MLVAITTIERGYKWPTRRDTPATRNINIIFA